MPEQAPHTATVRQAITAGLTYALENDPKVFLLGEDIADPMGGSYKITSGLSTKFGQDRVRNTPISEGAIIGAAVGASMLGLRPIAELMYVDFVTVAMDQLINQAAFTSYMSGGQLSVPAVFRCQGGAYRSSGAQHSKSLESWFAHVPGLKFVIPTDANDAYWLLLDAIEDPNPTIYFEPNLLYQQKSVLDTQTRPANVRAPKLLRTGSEVTIVTWGATNRMVLDAANSLDSEGITSDVWALRGINPLNLDGISASVEKTGLLLVVHEAWETAGLGAEISARIGDESFYFLDGPIKRIGALPSPHPFNPELEKAMLPSEDRIVNTCRSWFR